MIKLKKIVNIIKKNEFANKLVKNFSFAAIGEGGASFINLLVVVLLIKLIGNDGYGVLILAQSYMLIIDTIINLQCWKSMIKFGEKAYKNNDFNSLMGYIKLGTILDIGTAILGAIIGFFLTDLIGYIFSWESSLVLSAKIFSIVILFHFSGTPTAVLRMENKFNLVSFQKIISAVIKVITLLIFYLIEKKISIINGVVIYAITDIIGHIILVMLTLNLLQKKFGIKNILKAQVPKDSKEFIKFTMWTTLSDIVDLPVQYFDVFIVSKLGLGMVSIFKFFKQIVAILSKLTTPLYQAIFPQFSSLAADGKEREGYKIVLKIRNIILMVMIPTSLLIGFTSHWWLGLIFDNIYASYWYVLLIYLLLQSFALSYTTIHPYFVSLGEVFYSFKYVLISNIVYICLAFFLVGYLDMLGIVLAYAVQFTLVIVLKNEKIKKVLVVNNDNK